MSFANNVIKILLMCIIVLLLMTKVILERNEHHGLLNNFIQHDYNMTFERVERIRYNKDYAPHFDFAYFKYNRTVTAFNVTLNFKFDVKKMELVLQAYKFMSNEYRLFPVHFQMNLCQGIAANVAGISERPFCGNFTGCPMLKVLKQGKTYVKCNWMPDQSKFPPFITNGRYMVEVAGFYYTTRPEV